MTEAATIHDAGSAVVALNDHVIDLGDERAVILDGMLDGVIEMARAMRAEAMK